ncbi:MAG: hypothetical protein ACLU4J_01795 [Butyricimonas paravirosa]
MFGEPVGFAPFGLTFFDLPDVIFYRFVRPGDDEFFGFLLGFLDDCFPEFEASSVLYNQYFSKRAFIFMMRFRFSSQ